MDTYPSFDLMMGEEELEEDEEEERWDEPQMVDGASTSHTVAGASHDQVMDEPSTTMTSLPTSKEPVNLMALNTNKAGMEGLDKERINKIIMEASKGSRFYENEKKKEAQVNGRVDQMRQRMAKLTDQERQAALMEVDKVAHELEESRDLSRLIVHLDMDAFYAAVETRDNPSLKDKPMAVGGMSMLSTSNYHARKYGVRAAMPGFIGKKLCPELVIVPTNFDKYRTVSQQVREILAEYDPNFCPMSLDEAYLDLTDHVLKRQEFTEAQRTFVKGTVQQDGTADQNTEEGGTNKEVNLQGNTSENEGTQGNSCDSQLDQNASNSNTSSGQEQCQSSSEVKGESNEVESMTFGLTVEDAVDEIRFRIQQRTRLTASAGIAPNCMLAKVCSDKNKPNGQYRIEPTREKVMSFINVLPIRKVSGIGKVTERMLSALGIHTCADLYQQRALLHLLFSGISSHHFLRISLGLGSTRVERDSERKSMSTERTFREISKPDELYSKCRELCEALAEDLAQAELKGKTVGIKIKTVKFEVKTRVFTVPSHVSSAEELFNVAKDLLKTEIRACHPEPLRLRLMGVRLASLEQRGKSSDKQDTITRFFKKKQESPKTNETTQDSSLQSDKTLATLSDSTARNATGLDLAQTTEGILREPYLPSLSDGMYSVNTSQDADFTSSSHTQSDSHHHKEHVLDTPEVPISTVNEDTTPAASCSTSETFAGQSGGGGTQGLVCPICNKEQPAGDLEAFNTHVDMCLNKGAIKEILHQQAQSDQQTTSRKQPSPTKVSMKRSGSSQQSTAKRRKQDKKQGSTLHNFFN